MSSMALQFLQAFNLQQIALHVHHALKEQKLKKKLASEKLTLSYVMSQQGFAIAELFGYHLSKILKQDFREIAKRKGFIRLNQDQFTRLMNQLWINMDQYKLFLPILFEILKGFNNTISVKEIDTYLKLCKQGINSFMAKIKRVISPFKIKEMIIEIQTVCEKEDLKNQGFVQKLIIVDIIRKFAGESKEIIEIDQNLIKSDEVDYRLLLGQHYLKCGQRIKYFLKGKIADKIKKLIKKGGKKKIQKKKKQTKRGDRSPTKKKQTKQQKIIKQFIIQNKKQVKEDRKKLETMVKSIIFDCIFEAFHISSIDSQEQPQKKIKKSIYTAEPIIVQRELKCYAGQTVKIFPIMHDSGLFITEGEGRILNLLDGSIKSSFKLSPSFLLKLSPVCDYAYSNNTLYIIRQDGLLYSWNSQIYSYDKIVQTQFRMISKSIQQLNTRQILFVNQGIILVNCEQVNNSLELYSLNLQLIGNLYLNKQQFGITTAIIKQSYQLSHILKSLKRDYIIKSQVQYESLIRANYQFKQYLLGNYFFSKYQTISALKIGDYAEWINHYKAYNPLYLDKSMVQRLKINKTTKEDFEYLIDYQYIKEPTLTAIEIFLKEHCIIQVEKQRRKAWLITLFEDNSLKQINDRQQITRQQLLSWIVKCSLNSKQQAELLNNLTYNSQGKICLHQFIHCEQYLKIISFRQNRFSSKQYYQKNQLPPIIFDNIIPFPLLDFFIATNRFPNHYYLYIISFRNILINKINLYDYLQNKKSLTPPVLSFCAESGYLVVSFGNIISLWNISRLTQKNIIPTKIIRDLEKQPIIGLSFLYFSNTLTTLTKNQIKFWDLQQVLFNREATNIVFQIKPGFKAIQKYGQVSKFEAKKKILIRGRGQNIFNIPTISSNYLIGIISKGQRSTDVYMKIFYLCKFHIMISSIKQYDQIPLKILRQLDSQAKKMKFTQKIIDQNNYNQNEYFMIKKMNQNFHQYLNQIKYNHSKQLSISLINKINNLHLILNQYSKIINPYLLQTQLKIQDIKIFRFNLLLKIYLSQSNQELSSIFTQQFIDLYEQKGQLYKNIIINDIFQQQDRINLNKLLCILSQIYKYSLPYKCNYIQLIYNQKQQKLDHQLITILLNNSSISTNIIHYIISLINQIKILSIKNITIKIIDKFIPTQYKYPSLRYYKSIYTHTPQKPFDYFINRFDNYLEINLQQIISSPKGYKNIFDHIEKLKLKDQVLQLSKIYPHIMKDNLQLIDLCMSFSLITQQEATFYLLSPTNLTLMNIVSDGSIKKSINDFDAVISSIVYVISQKKLKIPTPQFTYQWFYDKFQAIIGNDDKLYDIFYNELKGSITQHTAYSKQLQFYIDLNKKNIRINYNPIDWQHLLGTRVYPLTQYIKTIQQKTYKQKIMVCVVFQRIIAEFASKQAQIITVRACASSKNHQSYIRNFRQDRNLKDYEDDYVNVQHFLYYLEEAKRQKQAQIISKSQLVQRKSKFQPNIPAFTLINILSKFTNYLTKNQLIQIISQSVSDFTYGSMIQWLKNIPFTRMKSRDGKQSRVCAIWQLKNNLKINWQILGWMMLNKYGKINILNKCIIINDTIDIKQLCQIFFSQSLFKLFTLANPQLKQQDSSYSLQILQKIVEKQLINPGLQAINQVFKFQIGKYFSLINQTLIALSNKIDQIDIDKLIKYFLTSSETKQSIIKLIFANIFGKIKKIKIKESLNKIGSMLKNYKETKYIQKWLQIHNNSDLSLLTKIIPFIEPHKISTIKNLQPQNLKITSQHLNLIIQKQQPWLYSYEPYFTITQFLDYLYELNLQNYNSNLNNLVNNCFLKHGIHSIFNSIDNSSFPQFYAKCRSVSKSLAKLTVIQFGKVYQTLTNQRKGLSFVKMFNASQYQILAEERIGWIVEYMSLLDKEKASLQNIKISNLIINLHQPSRQIQKLIESVKYQEYLVKKYIKSANKLAIILKQLQDSIATYQSLSEANMNHQQISILIKYLKLNGDEMLNKLRQSQSKATIQLTQNQENILLNQIAQYFTFFQKQINISINETDFNPNFLIKQKNILQTFLFQKMNGQNSPQWSCLPSYINLYQYCQNLLINTIFRKNSYRQMIIDELNKTLISTSMTLKNAYQIFGLAYMENINKYIPFFIPPNINHHAIPTNIFKILKKYLFQSFSKFNGINQIKYPLNFSNFKQIMGQIQLKSDAPQVNYSEIYKKLNIWGCGFVNLNDIPSQRKKRINQPYIQINTYISENYPISKGWRKISPPVEVFKNQQKICNQLIKLQQSSQSKTKIIKQGNLWRILGYYLTKQHRLYIQHEFKIANSNDCYSIVDLIEWINSNEDENEHRNANLLAKLVDKIQNEGGIYNMLRKYNRKIIIAQQFDNYRQQNAFLNNLIEQSNTLQISILKQYLKQLIIINKIQKYIDKQQQIQNINWLEQILILIINTYNKQIRQWSNYNNNLVKFLNQLPQNQFQLIQKLYQSNYQYNIHKLFDIMTNGLTYFTFTTFWVYNTHSDDAYPYQKDQVHQVYKIIDVNSDGNISYQQFCRFWSAVQQIYPHPIPNPINKITKIKQNILQTFLDSIQNSKDKQLQNEQGFLTIEMLESLTNIKHKHKLQRLIKIISPDDQYGIIIDTHKLKILLKQHKLKKIKQLHTKIKYSNYFASYLGSQIQQYINHKQNLQNTLSKWLVFTYPHFGYYLCQLFYDLGWKKQLITQWINQHKLKQQTKPIVSIQLKQNNKIEQQNIYLYNNIIQIPKKIQLFYKKYYNKNIQLKQYGKSISYKLYLNKILQQYNTIIQQINHITYFLQDIDHNQNKLIYQFQQQNIIIQQDQNNILSYNLFKKAIQNNKIPFSNPSSSINIKNNISFTIKIQSNFCKIQYDVINKDLRGKSNNRISLISSKILYNTKISNSFYIQQLSNLNKLVLYTDYSVFKPLTTISIAKNNKFASLQSMIKLVQLACYIYQNYQTIGLFVNIHNICINFNNQKQFRISQFIGGIKLDNEGNYFDGLNPKDINNDNNCIYPPDIYQDSFTQTFDSYCIAHILYFFYTGQIINNKIFIPSLQESNWFNYSQLHYIAKKQISLLALMDKNMDIQTEIVFFNLLKDCTSFEWHLRPKIYQILQTLKNIAHLNNSLQNIGNQCLIIKQSLSEICLKSIKQNNLQTFTNLIKSSQNYQWQISQLDILRISLPQDPKFYSIYNQILQQTLNNLNDIYQIQQLQNYIKCVTQYLCQSQNKQTTFLALQIYKNILISIPIKRYFEYCDQQWKINQFNIHQKLKQLNTSNRILTLPKSSQYYFDLSTLIDTKIALYMNDQIQIIKNKKHDSTKKIAITFIQSSLLSNNVNKVCALEKSGVLLNLYRYIQEPQFESSILKIYSLATECLNQQQRHINHRAIEQGYKVMMVMHNILATDKGIKNGQTVVDMLTYMNNYYNFYGQQCKQYVLKRLCQTQICNYPTFTFLFNLKIISKDYLYKILLNLSYQQKYYKMLKGVTVQAYDTYLREIRKNPKQKQLRQKLQKLIRKHELKISLNQLSNENLQLQNKQYYIPKQNLSQLFQQYENLIQKHILFYNKKKQKLIQGIQYQFENNFYQHYTYFLQQIRKIINIQIQNIYFNQSSCNFIKSCLQLHLKIINIWYIEQQTIKYILNLLENIYQKQYFYIENILLNSIQKIIFDIIILLLKKSKKILIKLGFIHFLIRIIKKQHQLIKIYVEKGVENIQLKTVYSQQAQFRLNVIDIILEGNNQDTHRILVNVGFSKYLIENMLASEILLDLRYYQANFDLVPFRFCNPLRSEAITLLSFILPIKDSILRSDIISRIISIVSVEKSKLQINIDNPENKMKFVEALWFFGNLIDCQDQRLSYELVNSGSYNLISKLLQRYEFLNFFFPKMSSTIKSGSILKSSIIFSRVLKN